MLKLAHLVGAEKLSDDWRSEFVPTGDAYKQIEQHFRFNNGSEPETIDPQLMTGVPEGRLALALFSGLATLHPRTLEPVPDLAESWEISEDGLTYTFRLREGLTWSDGVAITSATFVESWKRLLSPATASEYVYQLFKVKNAEAFFRGEVDFNAVGIRNPNPSPLK